MGWRSILALAAAAREDRPEALRLAGEAVELSSATDALLLEVDARMALAEVLRAVGEADAATTETRRALELCERKGATALGTAQRLPDANQSVATDGSVTVVRTDGRHRQVRENLATASADRIVAMLNAGDIAGVIEIASTIDLYAVGEVTPDQTRAYLSASSEAPLSSTITPLATLGERHCLYHGLLRSPAPWNRSRSRSPGASPGWSSSPCIRSRATAPRAPCCSSGSPRLAKQWSLSTSGSREPGRGRPGAGASPRGRSERRGVVQSQRAGRRRRRARARPRSRGARRA